MAFDMSVSLAFAGALLLCIGIIVSLWPGVGATSQGNTRIALSGFHGGGIVIAFTLFVVAAIAVGPLVSASVLLSLFLYELGQTLARRSLGMEEARLRLLPLPLVTARSRPSHDPAAEAYVTLMGAGLSIAPMTLAFALAQAFETGAPQLAGVAQTFAVTCGAVNFLLLLPFRPLDGGRCVDVVARSFWPSLGPVITLFLVSTFASAAYTHQSLGFLVLAGIGLQALLPRRHLTELPVSPNTALLILSTYSFTLATHFFAAWSHLKDLL